MNITNQVNQWACYNVRPVIQFSEDESVACRLVTNEAHVFDGKDFSKGIVDRLRLPGIDGVQLAHSPPSHIAAYVPEIKVGSYLIFPILVGNQTTQRA